MKDRLYWNKAYNPVTGCTPVSEACENCYARDIVRRFPEIHGVTGDGIWDDCDVVPFDHIQFHPERLDAPLHWKKPRRVFVGNITDLFHENVSDEWKELVYRVVTQCSQHQFLFLTKRPENIGTYFLGDNPELKVTIRNAWLGVTVEHQKYDHRVEKLLQIPAAVRWVSAEPLLGPLDIRQFLQCGDPKINWVVIGCESGPKRRRMKIEWAIDLVNQCLDAGVKVFCKQIHDEYGRVIHNSNKFPKELQIREIPMSTTNHL